MHSLPARDIEILLWFWVSSVPQTNVCATFICIAGNKLIIKQKERSEPLRSLLSASSIASLFGRVASLFMYMSLTLGRLIGRWASPGSTGSMDKMTSLSQIMGHSRAFSESSPWMFWGSPGLSSQPTPTAVTVRRRSIWVFDHCVYQNLIRQGRASPTSLMKDFRTMFSWFRFGLKWRSESVACRDEFRGMRLMLPTVFIAPVQWQEDGLVL